MSKELSPLGRGVNDNQTAFYGSANWFNKCDNAITVHRHKTENDDYAGIHVHKIRFQYKNGKPNQGRPAKLKYNLANGKYYEYIEERFKEDLFK